jgi:hypothetical protein
MGADPTKFPEPAGLQSLVKAATVNPFRIRRDERVLQAPNRSQPGPTSVCPGWPFIVYACDAGVSTPAWGLAGTQRTGRRHVLFVRTIFCCS